MIARTAPCIAKNGETLGRYYYAALSEPLADWPFAYCLRVFLPEGPGSPITDCQHVYASELDKADPCTEGEFLKAFVRAQQGHAAVLADALAFGLGRVAAATAPTHLVTTIEAVTLTDEDRPAYETYAQFHSF